MTIRTQRRMAAEVLGVGENRIWIDPDEIEKVASAITKEEIRRLIHEGVIRKRPATGISGGRAKLLRVKKAKGRRRGPGSRRGPRLSGKERWAISVRPLRKRLKELRDRKLITRKTYRKLRMMVKGGAFRGTSHLEEYIEAHKLARRR